MKRVLTSLLTMLVLTAGCGSQGDGTRTAATDQAEAAGERPFEGQTLVVTSYGGGWEEHMRANVVGPFEEETGVTVELYVGESADFAAQMEIAGPEDPPFDVVIANEAFMAGFREDGYFAPITEEQVPNLDAVQPAVRGTPGEETQVLALFNPIGLAYNTDDGTTAPTSWTALEGSGTDGRVGVFNVGSTPGPMVALTLAQDATGAYQDWQAGLDALASYCPLEEYGSVGDMSTAFTQGDISLGVHDLGAVTRMQAEGVPVEWVAPVEGVNAYDQNVNVAAASERRDLAYAWVDYFLSPDVQSGWMTEYLYLPTNTEVALSGPLAEVLGDRTITDVADDVLRYDWAWFNSGPRDELAEAWNRQISGGGC
jgi:putative spermidine/putrescine transport system substrate-binding protein